MLGHIDYLWEGLLTWSFVGVLTGYFVGFLGTRLNEGKSVLADIAAGLIGALVGGFMAHHFVGGRPGLFLSIAVAAVCAWGLTSARRALVGPRAR